MAHQKFNAPHFDLPFRLSTKDDAVQCVEQDDAKDVFNCVNCIVRYPRGSRLEVDDFGVDEMLFQNNPNPEVLLQQVRLHESRADLETVHEFWDLAKFTYTLGIGVD